MKSHLIRMLVLSVALGWGVVHAQEAVAPVKPITPDMLVPPVIADAQPKLLDKEGAGKLYQVGPCLVCVMEGTPSEMGFQHGRLLASRIHHGIKEGYMQKAFLSRGYTPEYINAQSERMEKHFPAEYIEEMRGVVKGLKAAKVDDITYEDIRTEVTQAELAHHPPNQPPDAKPAADAADRAKAGQQCSNFAAWGQWTPDGRLLHGRNLDWNIGGSAQEEAAILVWRPKGKSPFMMVGWAGAIGSVSGMNSRGITIGEMTSVSSEETFDGVPLLILMRRVLEEAGTLDQAVDIIKKGPRTTGWNFIIGDGKIPDARALEVDATDCTVFAPMDPKEGEATGHWAMADAVRRTNHPIGMKQLHKLALVYGPKYGIDPEKLDAAIPLLKLQNTWQRYDWLGKMIQALPKQLDVPQALQLLANGPVRNDSTLHSWVFDPKRKTAYVANAAVDPPATATSQPYVRVDFAPWFK